MKESRMDEAQFWTIIESGGRKALMDPERQLEAVRKKLKKLSPEAVRHFDQILHQKLADSYTWDLWGAAYLINGGCSDDGFDYFRVWLISQGRAVFMAAIENPDSLAGLTDPERDDYEFEGLWYISQEIYEELTGEEMPPIDFTFSAKPKGRRWDFDDDKQVLRRLPKLASLYIEEPDPDADLPGD